VYKVTKVTLGTETAYIATKDGNVLGQRGKYKMAQRLCEQTAGRELNWKSLGGGNYEGTHS
jgi:hypothetical protein